MNWSPDRYSLRGRIAVVAGATRGAARGIAAALGEAGATVICAGRSTRALGSSRSDYDRPQLARNQTCGDTTRTWKRVSMPKNYR